MCWAMQTTPIKLSCSAGSITPSRSSSTALALNAALGLDEVFWGENPTTPVRCSLPVSHPCPKSAANSCTFCQRMLCM